MKPNKETAGTYFKGFSVKIRENDISIQRNLSSYEPRQDARGGMMRPRLRYTQLKHNHDIATPINYPRAAFVEWSNRNSSNSPYNAGQDLNASGSFSSSRQESATNNNRSVPSTEHNYRLLEKKIEREREKRTHGDALPQPSRLDSKVLPEETSPSTMDIRRNGSRLSGKSTNATRTAADQSTTSSGSYRTASNKDVLSSMGTLTVASTPSSAALRGQSIGFGSRNLSTRSPTQRSKTRGGMVLPLAGNDKNKNGRYPYVDPVHSASPSFQQRLSELAALESDTIRYERTKRIKKRSKQENQ